MGYYLIHTFSKCCYMNGLNMLLRDPITDFIRPSTMSAYSLQVSTFYTFACLLFSFLFKSFFIHIAKGRSILILELHHYAQNCGKVVVEEEGRRNVRSFLIHFAKERSILILELHHYVQNCGRVVVEGRGGRALRKSRLNTSVPPLDLRFCPPCFRGQDPIQPF